ncbi:MAG: FG-GAP repeat protein [Ignavibacteria bacterium]|nr:FG-GAP repeat protein [Ignavibacteria bacterium]
MDRFTNLKSEDLELKKNFTKFYSIFYAIPVVLIFFILTSTAIPQNKNNILIPGGLSREKIFEPGDMNGKWIIPEKKNSIEADRYFKASSGKKDSLPEGVTDDWLNSLRDENGEKIIPENNRSGRIPEDPEGDAMQRKIFNGLGAGDNFGYSVSSAGDVNGDGYSDVIVGAYGYSSSTGRAYIFYGGLIMNTVADVTMTGESAGDFFGFSVSSAGDVNGDGYSDVIVGARWYSSANGKAYIYFGGASMNNTADVIMTGESISDSFGVSVSSAGDVNGDGYSDVIVGAHGYYIGEGIGRAYVYFGGASMNNAADVTITGETASNYFGYSVSSAGDINGDGYSDVIVGAFKYSSDIGRAYIYFGGASMNNTADVTMTGETAGDAFGYPVSSAGDVNGDGYSDVIVGAHGYSSLTGRAYIYFGGAAMNNIADVTMTGETASNYFGFSVSSAGDLNCDGYSDVIVGARGYSTNTGRAYMFFGGVSMNNIADVTMTGETTDNYFGNSVSSAGDVNGDGYSDVIVGAWGNSSNTGRVYLYDYFMKNDIVHDLAITGETTSNFFGVSVSSAGDVNGDGYSDVIVGAYQYSSGTGRAFIYFGGTSMNNSADVTMTGEATSNYFGVSVSSAGDVNGDGYSDVIVGAQNFASGTGRAYIYFGGASMNSTEDVTMTGETTNNIFGISVSSAGDVNGDGYSDVIVGASGYSSAKGRAYIYFGGASMNNTADVTMTGQKESTYFGFSVSSAGDLNGDGYSDVIVGAYGYSDQPTFIGRAYIYFGGASMNNTADVTMTGETTNNNFGYSVSSAGDVNDDGYSDVIVGERGYSTNTGRAYLYFGGVSMNNIEDVIMTGETIGNYFGWSVSSAGDVNGDGYSDVIVSAYQYSSSIGRAYIYFGGVSMNNTADVTMTGETTNNYFGISVSSAGDVNGDGYSDVIAGAYGYSSNTGRAYIYTGSAISVKPILISAKDVPNDQGGYLNLKFTKSGFDVPFGEIGGISYQIDRSVPPNINGYQWISVATVLGTYNSFYTAEIHTAYDSGTSGNNTYFFRVTAVSNSNGNFWRSNILSGYSLDNIAPPMVSPFVAAAAGTNVNLNWGSNPAPDFLNYVLFRSVSPVIDPNTSTPLSIVTTTTYTDTSPLSGISYYFIVAQDIHGNYSPVALQKVRA